MDRTLPARYYYEPEFLEKEKKLIFDRSWLLVSLSSRIPNPGDYTTLDYLDYRILVVRQPDRSVKGFINACRHRAMTILEGTGVCKANCITCEYHRFVYNLDGTLRKAPGFNLDKTDEKCNLPTLDIEDLSLLTLPVKEVAGLIFVNPTTDSTNQLSFPDAIETALRLDLNNYIYHSTKVMDVTCNWKVFVENFLECYHCSSVHPLFAREYDLSKYDSVDTGGVSDFTCPAKMKGILGGLDGHWVWMKPNIGFELYEKYMNTITIIPVDAKNTKIKVDYYGRCDLSKDEIKESLEQISQVTFDEDLAICVKVQRGLDTKSINTEVGGPLHPDREKSIIYFLQLYREAMGI